MPFEEVPTFVRELRERESISARSLEFLILCAARSGEARGALWSEIDVGAAVWRVPADRMKWRREHRVPLVPRALEIIEGMEAIRCSDYVFPGSREGRLPVFDSVNGKSARTLPGLRSPDSSSRLARSH
jgi:integrase